MKEWKNEWKNERMKEWKKERKKERKKDGIQLLYQVNKMFYLSAVIRYMSISH